MAKVLVICGGDTPERLVSLNGGDAVARGLVEAGHDAFKLDTAKPDTIVPHDVNLLKKSVNELTAEELKAAKLTSEGRILLASTISTSECDVVFPILHGGWGEDGRFQAFLELIGKHYLGSSVQASETAMNKRASREMAKKLALPVAEGAIINDADEIASIYEQCSEDSFARYQSGNERKLVVKPNRGGSSADMGIVSTKKEFTSVARQILKNGDSALVEDYIPGRELTVAMVDGKPMPVVEIAPKDGYYNYKNKYTKGMTEYLCPAPIDAVVAALAQDMSQKIHDEMDCRHLARVDWRLTPDNQLVFLEVNTIPGMMSLSLVPMAAKTVGIDFPDLMNRFVLMVQRDNA